MAASEGEYDALELCYHVKGRKVQRIVRRGKRISTIAFVKEAEASANSKNCARDRRPFNVPVRDVNGRLLIRDDEQLK